MPTWTDELDDMIRAYATSSTTYTEASEALQISSMKIQRRAKELGVKWVRGGIGIICRAEKQGPEITDLEIDLEPLRTIATVRSRECRFPLGDPKLGGVCGRPKHYLDVAGRYSSYCETHHMKTHVRK